MFKIILENMKKILLVLGMMGILFLSSCGSSPKEIPIDVNKRYPTGEHPTSWWSRTFERSGSSPKEIPIDVNKRYPMGSSNEKY